MSRQDDALGLSRQWPPPGKTVMPNRTDESASDSTVKRDAALTLDTFLPYRLNVAASVTSQALSRIYADRYKFGVPEWRVLVTLGEFGTMTGKAIGVHSHMHKTKVSRAVALLEQRKLVARKANREDMREAFLSLTAAGRTIYDDLAPAALDFSRQLVDALEPGDRAALDRALRGITERAADLAKGNHHR
jgi:DNA-binding MarR family transcriptional regulator